MTVNPDVHGCTKTVYHQKILQKMQKIKILKTKKRLKAKYKLIGGQVFTFNLPVLAIRPPLSVPPL